MKAHQVVKYPLATEKSIRMMEAENKLVFVVDRRATKQDVKTAIESLFDAKVIKVNVANDMKGRRKAFVKFTAEVPAIDIATKLGLM